MTFLSELIKSIENSNPDDWWIKRYRENIEIFPKLENEFKPYEQALEVIDDKSRKVIFEKAKQAFLSNHKSRGKHQFFDILNEALAYEYLINEGFSNVYFLLEDKKRKTPDIGFIYNNINYFCEVKTIGVSDNALESQRNSCIYDSSIYKKLNSNFFDKLKKTIDNANSQMLLYSNNGLMYIIINFDDLTLTYYDKYQEQISEYLVQTFPSLSIVLRIGKNKHYQLSHNNVNTRNIT